MDAERWFPLQAGYSSEKCPPHPLRIPWSVAEKAYCVYARLYGKSQSLERLAERGGFGGNEMDELYPPWRDEVSEIVALRAENARLREAMQRAASLPGKDWLQGQLSLCKALEGQP